MDDSGDGSEERAIVFAKLLGVRDGTSRDATTAEMTKVAKNLYFFLVKRYHEGLKAGKWDEWDEERDFPRHEFQSGSSRVDSGVFDGFDFPKWAEQELANGLEGTKAVEVFPGPTKKKVVIWEAPLCGSGLKNTTKQGIEDHLDDQGAMAASARNKKKVKIYDHDQTTVFLQRKGWSWISDTHLFVDGPIQRKMNLYCGKKIGGEHCILMKDVAESA